LTPYIFDEISNFEILKMQDIKLVQKTPVRLEKCPKTTILRNEILNVISEISEYAPQTDDW
jgi:hypothetical protein